MKPLLALLLPALFIYRPTAPECEYEAERTAAVNAADAELVRVIARAGALRVDGIAGLTEVHVRGRACTSDRELLDAITVAADRSGGEVRIEAVVPDRDGGWGWGNDYARLDLTIEVPAGIAAAIDDSSGELEARNTGALQIDDSSGEIFVEDVAGPLRIDDSAGEITVSRAASTVVIDDSSGEIDLTGAGGDVEITDDSGEIDVRDVQGSVTLRDGSGDIDVAQVTGSVVVADDGSGSIRVADVQGNFTVESDGSGDVRYSRVGGEVRVASN